MSPLLFNLVAEALSEILNVASEKGIIHGLCEELVDGGLPHLQYVDDTLLFLQHSDVDAAHLKFLLFCFEELSGMKINYLKSEVFNVGLGAEDSQKNG